MFKKIKNYLAERRLRKLWISEGRNPAHFPRVEKVTKEDIDWATKEEK